MRLFLFAALAALPVSAAAFSDVPVSHPNHAAIGVMAEEGIVKGYADGTFRPDAPINRAEFVKILIGGVHASAYGQTYEEFERHNLLSTDCVKQAPHGPHPFIYDDVATTAWYALPVCRAYELGWVSGYPDGTFKPAQTINAAEASKILAKAFGIEARATDVWYEGPARALEERAALPVSLRSFSQPLTRGEMAEMIARLKAGDLSKPTRTYDEMASESGPRAVYVQIDSLQNPPMHHHSNRNLKMLVMALSPASWGETELLGTVMNDISYQSFAVRGRIMYYIRSDGRIGAFNLDDGKATLLPVPTLKAQPTDSGILPDGDAAAAAVFISGDELLYTRGSCAEGYPCLLRAYHLISGKDRLIVDLKANGKNPGGFTFVSAHGGTLTMNHLYGDGPGIGGSRFSIDLQTGALTEIGSASSSGYCEHANEPGGDPPCSAEDTDTEKVMNDAYNGLFVPPTVTCGDVALVEQGNGEEPLEMLYSNGAARTVEKAWYAGCLE